MENRVMNSTTKFEITRISDKLFYHQIMGR